MIATLETATDPGIVALQHLVPGATKQSLKTNKKISGLPSNLALFQKDLSKARMRLEMAASWQACYAVFAPSSFSSSSSYNSVDLSPQTRSSKALAGSQMFPLSIPPPLSAQVSNTSAFSGAPPPQRSPCPVSPTLQSVLGEEYNDDAYDNQQEMEIHDWRQQQAEAERRRHWTAQEWQPNSHRDPAHGESGGGSGCDQQPQEVWDPSQGYGEGGDQKVVGGGEYVPAPQYTPPNGIEQRAPRLPANLPPDIPSSLPPGM